jgi:hypothetical protein
MSEEIQETENVIAKENDAETNLVRMRKKY